MRDDHLPPPRSSHDPLFVDVATQGLFADGKTFVDAVPRQGSLAHVQALYAAEKGTPGFSLAAFVAAHFVLPDEAAPPRATFRTDASRSLREHIDALWPHLTRWDTAAPQGDATDEASTLLPLPAPYVVPGGRFREIYYWDSYFTLLGLVESGRHDLAQAMVDNFAFLIDRHGHMPNGNRRYYLSRSHPPFFFKMVEALAPEGEAAEVLARYLPQLRREHAYWMAGADTLAPGEAIAHVVRLPDGSLLNRHWDACDAPRDEMFAQDLHTASQASRPHAQVWRDLRGACESGWDFSSRWAPFRLGGEPLLPQLETTSLVPIDLNCLLHGMESAIARACGHVGDSESAAAFAALAARRHEAIDHHLWSPERGHYVDHHWERGCASEALTAATLYPLFAGLASTGQASQVASQVERHLLKAHGLATTTVASGEQWDLPNGWAPLQWVAIDGLNRCGHPGLAREIATRWLHTVEHVYRTTGKLLEKYDVTSLHGSVGGGEYPTQDGFGWTNGVTRKLMAMYS